MPDPITGIIGGVATVASGAMGSKASSDASQAQTDAARYQADISKEMYDQTRADLQPFTSFGLAQMPNILKSMQPIDRTQALSDFYAGPEYSMMSQQASNNLLASGEATGNLTGSTMQNSLASIAPQLGMQHLGMLENQRADAYNMAMQPFNMAQNAAAQTGAAGQTYASQAGQAAAQAGQASAQNSLAQAALMGNTLNTLAGGYMGYKMGGW